MIQMCGKFHWALVFVVNSRRDEIMARSMFQGLRAWGLPLNPINRQWNRDAFM